MPVRVLQALATGLVVSSVASATPTLEAGWGHNVAVSPAGEAWAWGQNDLGVLGNGTTTNSPIPVRAAGLADVVAVAAGGSVSAALRGDGTVWTWGAGFALGIGTTPGSCQFPDFVTGALLPEPCSKVPVRVSGVAGATAIAAGEAHVLVLLGDGTVRAWGRNTFGQVGNGTVTDATVPVAVSGLSGVTRIAAGADASYALRADGTVWAWGNGTHGELGTGAAAPSACAGDDAYQPFTASRPCARTPVRVPGLAGIAAISARGRHVLALATDGAVWAWGSNHYGQVGDATTAFERRSPIAVAGMTGVAQVAAGFSHSVVRRNDGTVWAWGLGKDGQLGVAATQTCANESGSFPVACRRSPAQAASHAGASTVVAGGAHTIVVRPDGTLVAFGWNGSGQLGYGAASVPTTLRAIDPHIPLYLGAIGPGSAPGTSLGIPGGLAGINLGALDLGLSFSAQAVGTSSTAREVQFRNLRESPLGIRSVAASGNFRASSACGASLAGGASCSTFVTFSPTLPGRREGTLSFATDSPDESLVALPLSGTGTSATIPVNYSDIWWNPAESGWGLTVADHETTLFAVWYTYDASGRPTWFTVPGGTFSQDRRYFSGDVYASTGPCYASASFDPALVRHTRVGSATLDFAPAGLPSGWARFSGAIGTTSWSKAIARQPFGNASADWGADYTDIWWNAAESGWGLSLSQHGNNVFGVLFTYECDGTPLFVVLPGVSFAAASVFSGDLFTTRSSGPWWGSATFDPARITVTRVGSASVAFSGRTATFSSVINGATRIRPVVQQPFGHRAPGSP